MVILNMEVLICKLSMEKSIKKIMQEVMNEYFNDEVLGQDINMKKNILEKKIDEKMKFVKSNNFWYINSSRNVCTFIHKRGKKEGYMCHRKKKNKYSIHNVNIANYNWDYKSKNNVKKLQKKRIKLKNIITCNSGKLNLADIFKKY